MQQRQRAEKLKTRLHEEFLIVSDTKSRSCTIWDSETGWMTFTVGVSSIAVKRVSSSRMKMHSLLHSDWPWMRIMLTARTKGEAISPLLSYEPILRTCITEYSWLLTQRQSSKPDAMERLSLLSRVDSERSTGSLSWNSQSAVLKTGSQRRTESKCPSQRQQPKCESMTRIQTRNR